MRTCEATSRSESERATMAKSDSRQPRAGRCPARGQSVQTLDFRQPDARAIRGAEICLAAPAVILSATALTRQVETSLIHREAEKVTGFSSRKPLTVRMNGGRYKSPQRLTSVGVTTMAAPKPHSIHRSWRRTVLHVSPVNSPFPTPVGWAGDLLAQGPARIFIACPPPGKAVSSSQVIAGRSA